MIVIENNNYISVECPGCKSKLGIHLEDIRYNEITHNCSSFEATCCACGNRIAINESLIPRNWIITLVPNDFTHQVLLIVIMLI